MKRPLIIERRKLPARNRHVPAPKRTVAPESPLLADLRRMVRAGRFPRSLWEPCGGVSVAWVADRTEIAASGLRMAGKRGSNGGEVG